MIYLKSFLKVIDNSGAQIAECIKVLGKGSPKSPGRIGDKIVCVVKKAKPLTQTITGQSNNNRVKKGDIVHAVVVRTKQRNMIRPDGSINGMRNPRAFKNAASSLPLFCLTPLQSGSRTGLKRSIPYGWQLCANDDTV